MQRSSCDQSRCGSLSPGRSHAWIRRWHGQSIGNSNGLFHIPTKYSLSRRRTTPTQAVSPLSNREDDHPSLRHNEVGPSRLCHMLQGDVIAKPFEGLHRPLALLCLLSRLEVRVPCLLIERPLGKKVIDDHQDFVSSCQCRFLSSETPVQSPERLTQKRWRCARRPGALHQHPSEIAIPFPLRLSRFMVYCASHHGES